MINDTKNDLETILSILSTSPIHKKYTIEDINRLVIPPLKLNQYIIYEEDGSPECYISWAFFSPEVNQKYITENYRLQEDDWNSGDICWLINVVSSNNNAIKYLLKLDRERKKASELEIYKEKNLNNIFFRRLNKEVSSKKVFRVAKRA
jgi:hemolysin-activating ACP:hemolysin acyltransferase